jgi:mycofactocin glycosyltransferase
VHDRSVDRDPAGTVPPPPVTGPPLDTGLAPGTSVRLDSRARTLDGGAVLLGGAPPRLLYLAPAARALIASGAFTVTDPTSATVARTLIDAGIAHPVRVPAGAAPQAGDVTVVVPVKDRVAGLARLLAALPAGLGARIVVDDGSADPAARIVALPPITGWLGRYEAVRSSLDLGPDPALVVPRSRVAYVPSAALVVRRIAAGVGFDERLHVAEDVDLVLRMHAAGWRLRYAPAARVAHDHRTAFGAWWLRKAYYGTGAAPLALRHRGAVPPMVLSPTSAAIVALLLTRRPAAGPPALLVGAVAALRLAGKLRVRHPRRTAARLVALGSLGALSQAADAVDRHYWPLSLAAAVLSRRVRRTVMMIALAEGIVDWWRHRDRDPRVRLDPITHLAAHRLDDLAYGAGLWWGAWRHRSWEPLRPVGPTATGPLRKPPEAPPVRISPKD